MPEARLPESDFDDSLDSRLERLWSGDHEFGALHTGLKRGQQVAHFRIRALLGCGAFGFVYLADDSRTDQPVALKLPDKRQRFGVEAGVAEKLEHPGIVKVRESDLTGPVPFIATEWCDGPDLSQWLAIRLEDKLPVPEWRNVVELVAAVADAIEHAHEKGIAHRDLKPANILLNSSNEDTDSQGLRQYKPQVTDFGLAKLDELAVADSRSSLMIGTPMYMAPERLNIHERFDGDLFTVARRIRYSVVTWSCRWFERHSAELGQHCVDLFKTKPSRALRFGSGPCCRPAAMLERSGDCWTTTNHDGQAWILDFATGLFENCGLVCDCLAKHVGNLVDSQ